MKKLLLALFLLITSLTYSQNAIIFNCNKLTMTLKTSDKAVSRNIDVKFTLDFKNQNIIFQTYNNKNYCYDSETMKYFRDDRNEDGSHTYSVISNRDKNGVTTITFNSTESKIYLLDSTTLYIFDYNKFEIIK